jgi:hypothetical protein
MAGTLDGSISCRGCCRAFFDPLSSDRRPRFLAAAFFYTPVSDVISFGVAFESCSVRNAGGTWLCWQMENASAQIQEARP